MFRCYRSNHREDTLIRENRKRGEGGRDTVYMSYHNILWYNKYITYNIWREGDCIPPRRHRRKRVLSTCRFVGSEHTTRRSFYLCRIRRWRLACHSSAHRHSIIAVIWRIHARYSLGKWRITGFKQRRN